MSEASSISSQHGSSHNHGHGHGHSNDSPVTAVANYVSDHSISSADIIKFLFPHGKQHPNSATRLFLLADYGPLYSEHAYSSCLCPNCMKACREHINDDEIFLKFYRGQPLKLSQLHLFEPFFCENCIAHCKGIVHLKSGFKGTHIVSDQELIQMEVAFDRDEIVSMYMPLGTMDRHELEQMVYQLPPRLRKQHRYTPDEIIELFKPCKRNDHGDLVFQSFAERAHEIHRERIKQAKKMFPDVTGKGQRGKPASATLQNALHASQALAETFEQTSRSIMFGGADTLPDNSGLTLGATKQAFASQLRAAAAKALDGIPSAASKLTLQQAMAEPNPISYAQVRHNPKLGFLKPLGGSDSLCLSVPPPRTPAGRIEPSWRKSAAQVAGNLIAQGSVKLNTMRREDGPAALKLASATSKKSARH